MMLPTEPRASDRTGVVIPFRNQQGDSLGLEAVFRENEAGLRRFLAIRLRSEADAQDVLQLTFLRLWQKRHTLRNENLRALLYVSARNLAADFLRQRNRNERVFQGVGGDPEPFDVRDETAGPDRALSAKGEIALVLDGLEQLSERCRSAFIRYKFHDENYSEIAQDMGVSESMIRKYVLRAVVHCTHILSEAGSRR